MDLIHNTAFRILVGPDAGIYRVVLDEVQIGKTAVVRLDPETDPEKSKGGRKHLETIRRPRKKSPPPLVGEIIWKDRAELHALKDSEEIIPIELVQDNRALSSADEATFEFRKNKMAPFLDFDHFREQILIHRGVGSLAQEVMKQECSKSFVYSTFSLLCRFGFQESSLRPNRHRCGAPREPRPCDPDGRKKAGRKTTKQRLAMAFGKVLEPEQPGISSVWRSAILAADKLIPTPKPPMPQRSTQIIHSAFIQRFTQADGKLIPSELKLGEYPNRRQIRRVLEHDIPWLQRLLERTTKGHFNRSLRGLIARNWKGVVGPGHTWAIDSSIGDAYLRSNVNRAWIIGRPVVYIIVDIWSTAVVGFFVCLDGPSWDMAKVALFCAAAPSDLVAELWGYESMLSLYPAPTMCAALMCDRGEYLSKAASLTGARLILDLSYAPPYRPDLKGLVEVLHRITKDRQYYFVPGAIDQRREEFELRRFDPNEAVLTVRDYAAYLYQIFTEYNLTAPREKRLDAHMHAAGVFPSPDTLKSIAVIYNRYDFVSKPVTPLDLITKVENALTWTKERDREVSPIDWPEGLEVDPNDRIKLFWKGERVNLTLTQRSLVDRLARAPGLTVPYRDLTAILKSAQGKSALATHFSNIRKAFCEIDQNWNEIEAVARQGYRWKV